MIKILNGIIQVCPFVVLFRSTSVSSTLQIWFETRYLSIYIYIYIYIYTQFHYLIYCECNWFDLYYWYYILWKKLYIYIYNCYSNGGHCLFLDTLNGDIVLTLSGPRHLSLTSKTPRVSPGKTIIVEFGAKGFKFLHVSKNNSQFQSTIRKDMSF